MVPTRRFTRPLAGGLALLAVAIATGPASATARSAPVSIDAALPGVAGAAESITVAADERTAAALIRQDGGGPSRLVQVGLSGPARLVRTFEGAVDHPTVGTDAAGRAVVLTRVCSGPRAATRRTACRIEGTDLLTGAVRRLPGSTGATVAAIDRGRVAIARGARVALTSVTRSWRAGRTTTLPPLPVDRPDAPPVRIADLDVRLGVIAATVELGGEWGGSALARYEEGRRWATYGLITGGGAALGPRTFLAPQVTGTGIRAFFDGSGDFAGFAARWGRSPAPQPKRWGQGGKPLRKVVSRRLGDPAFLSSAAFLGNRLLVASDARDDPCQLATCTIRSYGPFELG